jgi:hypothetical protein
LEITEISSTFATLSKIKIEMQALRQIVSVKDNLLHVVLPTDFKADKVEIIVFPIEEQIIPNKPKNSERFYRAISKETAEKLHNHLNEVRNEWE